MPGIAGKRLKLGSVLLALILVSALLLRLDEIGFGFPALYDPDEPVFEMLAVHLLRDHTLNPGWFGHPGTTTIYSLTLINIAIYVFGLLSHQFTSISNFATAVYLDPSLLFLPGRVFITASGVVCVWLTFRIGQRLFGDRVGLLAAAILAVDPTHIQFSQLIRTDVHATVFMLAGVLSAIEIGRHGRLRSYMWAGIFTGLATATKWPGAAVMFCIMGACGRRMVAVPSDRARQARWLGVALGVAFATLVLVSPYLLLDLATLLRDVRGEADPTHVGANGGDFAYNLGWYLSHPLHNSLGPLGEALVVLGLFAGSNRNRLLLACVLPGPVIFLVVICAHSLVWARWIVPLLPYAAILVAVAVDTVARRVGQRTRPAWAGLGFAAVAIGLLAPALATDRSQAVERGHDTRALASAWARAHIAPGSTVVVEHAAFDLMRQPWRLMFPIGDGGCVDVRRVLGGAVRYSKIGAMRRSSAAVDLGSVDPAKLGTCKADWIIAANYGRYLDEAPRYAREIAQYQRLFAGGRVRATFRPVPGAVGGPVVYVVQRDVG